MSLCHGMCYHTPGDDFVNKICCHMGHSTSNEQIFRNPHALRPRILFNFFYCVAKLSI